MADKSRKIISILIIIILVLIAILIYAFIIRPGINGYVFNKQIEGYQTAYSEILQVVAQCKTFPVKVSENQTINLIAVECLQQPQNNSTSG